MRSLAAPSASAIRLNLAALSGSAAVSGLAAVGGAGDDPNREDSESANPCAGGRAGASTACGSSKACQSGCRPKMAIETQAVATPATPQRSRCHSDTWWESPCSTAIRDSTCVDRAERSWGGIGAWLSITADRTTRNSSTVCAQAWQERRCCAIRRAWRSRASPPAKSESSSSVGQFISGSACPQGCIGAALSEPRSLVTEQWPESFQGPPRLLQS